MHRCVDASLRHTDLSQRRLRLRSSMERALYWLLRPPATHRLSLRGRSTGNQGGRYRALKCAGSLAAARRRRASGVHGPSLGSGGFVDSFACADLWAPAPLDARCHSRDVEASDRQSTGGSLASSTAPPAQRRLRLNGAISAARLSEPLVLYSLSSTGANVEVAVKG